MREVLIILLSNTSKEKLSYIPKFLYDKGENVNQAL